MKKFQGVGFSINFLHRFRFYRKPNNQWISFRLHLLNKTDKFCTFPAFSKSMVLTFDINNVQFLDEKFLKRQVLRWKNPTCRFLKEIFNNGTDFEPRVLQRVWFWIKVYAPFQILQ